MLNVASTGMFTILTLIVNLKWYACKKWTSSLKLVVILAQYRYTKTAQRIFKYSDVQYISLTLDETLNSLVYRKLFYVNIYGSYTLQKTVRFFGPPCTSYWCRLFSGFNAPKLSKSFIFWQSYLKNKNVDVFGETQCIIQSIEGRDCWP